MALILVTGGTGYIGSHTVVELLNSGYSVDVMDDLSNSREEVLDSIEKITGKRPGFYKTDMSDLPAVESYFRHHKPDAVIHFAAKKLVGESVENPLLYYRNNLFSLINLLMECRKHAIANMVFSSSCTVYGQPDKLPVDEHAPLKKAESPYGATKQMAEDILTDCSNAYGLNVITLRYFNPVGAHQSALIGEYPIGPPSNLMPVITRCAAGMRDSFNVFGDDYNTADGSCIRDYVHVVDLARAHVAAIRRQLKGAQIHKFEIFNLGTGKGISVFEMIHAFESVNHVKLNYKVTGRRPGDVEQVWASTEKANSILGWKALLGIDEMVLSAWNWEKQLLEKRKSGSII